MRQFRGIKADPAQLIMVLERLRLSGGNLNQPYPHRGFGVQGPALVQRSGYLGAQNHLNAQFFGELTVQGSFAGLPRLNLAPGKLPHPGIGFGRGPAGGQQAPWLRQIIDDGGSDYLLQF